MDGEGNRSQNLRFAQVLTCAALLQLELTGPPPSGILEQEDAVSGK